MPLGKKMQKFHVNKEWNPRTVFQRSSGIFVIGIITWGKTGTYFPTMPLSVQKTYTRAYFDVKTDIHRVFP